jgi:hypothetical protein
MASEEDSAFSRGRIPAHEVGAVMEMSSILLKAKTGAARHCAHLIFYGCDPDVQQSTVHIVCRSDMEMIRNHFMSYNKFSRPYIFFDQPRVDDPTIHFSSFIYCQFTGFWPEQIEEICQELVLLLDIIKCPSTGCHATKHLALFLLLRRWHIVGSWESVSYDLHQQCSWCIQVYHATLWLLAASYQKCIRILDYH